MMREIHRGRIATAYLHAAAMVVTHEVNGNRQRPELAVVTAAQRCRVPLVYAMPFLRDTFGFTYAEFTAWEASLEPLGGAFVLRMFAHAIHERDI